MVIDTSALLAVLLEEPEGAAFDERLAAEDDPILSAATLVEAAMVVLARLGDPGVARLDELLETAGVRCVAVDRSQAMLARGAFRDYGKGRSPAGLNLGDCFAYALAKAHGRPLLYKGNDFSRTDIAAA